MAKMNINTLIEREAKAQARKDEWRAIYEDCYEFALPQRNLYSGYYEGRVAGKEKPQEFLTQLQSIPHSALRIGYKLVCFPRKKRGVD